MFKKFFTIGIILMLAVSVISKMTTHSPVEVRIPSSIQAHPNVEALVDLENDKNKEAGKDLHLRSGKGTEVKKDISGKYQYQSGIQITNNSSQDLRVEAINSNQKEFEIGMLQKDVVIEKGRTYSVPVGITSDGPEGVLPKQIDVRVEVSWIDTAVEIQHKLSLEKTTAEKDSKTEEDKGKKLKEADGQNKGKDTGNKVGQDEKAKDNTGTGQNKMGSRKIENTAKTIPTQTPDTTKYIEDRDSENKKGK